VEAAKRYKKLYIDYHNRFDELAALAERQTVRSEYSKGGNLTGGYYSHSRGDLYVGNCSRGRLCKTRPKKDEFDYKYDFDADDRLLCTTYMTCRDKKRRISDKLFFVYRSDEIITLAFDLPPEQPQLDWVCHTKLANGKIVSYESARMTADRFHYAEKEEFGYSAEGLLTTLKRIVYYEEFVGGETKTFILNRDSEGKFSMYAAENVLNGIVKNTGFIYTVGGSKTYAYDGNDKPCPVRGKEKARKKMTGIDLEDYLFQKTVPIIEGWDEQGVYAISFLVYSNEAYEYNGVSNVTEFSVSCNTEDDCSHAPPLSEERWNFAFWRQDMTGIISADDDDEGMSVLFHWYKKHGIKKIGYEDPGTMYNEGMKYIGKGPAGYYELLMAVSNVARRLQLEGVVEKRFGKIPIIVHDLEYAWYVRDATENANPNGEADLFLQAHKDGFPD
jgi:hypothetical protein